MGRRRDSYRIGFGEKERIEIAEFRAAERAGDKFPLLAVGIDDAHQLDGGYVRQDAGMVATHDANANHTEFQWTTRTDPASLTHPEGLPSTLSPTHSPLAWQKLTGDPIGTEPEHVLLPILTRQDRARIPFYGPRRKEFFRTLAAPGAFTP
jgi:hypothetical protein